MLSQQALELYEVISKTAELAQTTSAKVRMLDREQVRVQNAIEQVDKAQQLKVFLRSLSCLSFKELHCWSPAGCGCEGF